VLGVFAEFETNLRRERWIGHGGRSGLAGTIFAGGPVHDRLLPRLGNSTLRPPTLAGSAPAAAPASAHVKVRPRLLADEVIE
jgi:hypothetical protein